MDRINAHCSRAGIPKHRVYKLRVTLVCDNRQASLAKFLLHSMQEVSDAYTSALFSIL